MRAISLWQPWALAWLLPGEKLYETRPKPWYYRGSLLVHAAKKRDGDVRYALEDEEIIARLKLHNIAPADLAFGAIIGKVDLIDCRSMAGMPKQSKTEYLWGNWTSARFALQRGMNPVIFREPIPYRGEQGLFNVPDELIPKEYR